MGLYFKLIQQAKLFHFHALPQEQYHYQLTSKLIKLIIWYYSDSIHQQNYLGDTVHDKEEAAHYPTKFFNFLFLQGFCTN